MKIVNNSRWKKFHIYDLFIIDNGSKLDKVKMKTDNPKINFVGRSSAMNGVTDFVNEVSGLEPYKAGYLTLALGGAYLGSCFVQEKDFYTSQNVVVLIPKFEMSLKVKQFIATAIFRESQNNYKAFVKELNAHIKRDFEFFLPVNDQGMLDVVFIENFMEEMSKKTKDKINGIKSILNNMQKKIDSSSWKKYKLTDLFEIKGSTTTPKGKLDLENGGDYPYVTTAASNNGVSGYSKKFTEKGGVLTVDSAVAGTCLYQAKNFTASDHVEKLIPKFNMSENVALFIVTIMNVYSKIFNYAYNEKRSQKALKEEQILLPSKGNKIDIDYMESFINDIKKNKSELFRALSHFAADKLATN